MKHKLFVLQLVCCSFALHTYGQGTFIYDQQSTNLVEGAAFLNDGFDQPMGQSFTPSLSTVAFVELYLYDAGSLPVGATVRVNLRTNSVTGQILSSSGSVAMTNQFFGTVVFTFSTPVPVTPNVRYYFEPEVLSGDGWGAFVTDGSYVRGDQIYQGFPISNSDLWFREGTIVPEPSSIALALLGGGVAAWCVRKKRRG